jgi:hypothetical protein
MTAELTPAAMLYGRRRLEQKQTDAVGRRQAI